ncbi:MAG: hypothetical protein WC608_00630 [Parcubacteria group bacterium]
MNKLSDRQIKKFVESVSDTVALSMRTFREELQYSEDEVAYSVNFFEKEQKIIICMRERIFRKVLKAYETHRYDSGLLFDRGNHRIFISLHREDAGIRALEFIFRRILAFFLKEKKERINRKKLELKKNISASLSIAEDKFKISHGKNGEYRFFLRRRGRNISIAEKIPEKLEETVSAFASVIKKVC